MKQQETGTGIVKIGEKIENFYKYLDEPKQKQLFQSNGLFYSLKNKKNTEELSNQ